jgi:hypothetical protein
MNGVAGFLFGAALSAAAGGIGLALATFERHMADAQERLATREYADAEASLESALRWAEYASWLPWIGSEPVRDVRARQAALRYWQGDYQALLPERGDAVTSVDPDNAALQLVVANAAFRAAQSRMTSQPAAMQALDEAMSGYLNVLRNATWFEDAAHNYEYVARLRDDIARGRRKPEPETERSSDAFGQSGAPAVPTDRQQFEIYIPLETEERPDTGEAGKAAPARRRG